MKDWIFRPLIFLIFGTFFFLFLIPTSSNVGISYDWLVPQSKVTFQKYLLNSSWTKNDIVPPAQLFYIETFYRFFFVLNVEQRVVTIVLLISVFMIAGLGFYHLMRKITMPGLLVYSGSIIYMSSQLLFQRTFQGWLGSLIAIATTPLLAYVFISYLERGKIRDGLVGSILFSISTLQIQFLFINTILLTVIALFYNRGWKRILKVISIYGISNLLLNLPWLLVYLRFQNIVAVGDQLVKEGYRGFQGNTIMDLLSIPWVIWSIREYLNSLHLTWLVYLWLLSQIGIFVVPVVTYTFLRRKISGDLHRWFGIGFTLLTLGLLITKGRENPFSWIGDTFYRIPVLAGMFRNIHHFYYLITLGSVLLFVLAIHAIHQRLVSPKRQRIFIVGCLLFSLVYASPYLLHAYRSRLHLYSIDQRSYQSLFDQLNHDSRDDRVLWLPIGLYVRYNDGHDFYTGINPLPLNVKKGNLEDWNLRLPNTSPSLLTRLIHLGFCDQIPGCVERTLGLFSVRQVIDLTRRDFHSAVPFVNPKEIYRNSDWWSPQYHREWWGSRSLAKRQQSKSAYDLYELNPNIVAPPIYVPDQISSVHGHLGHVIDGIIFNSGKKPLVIMNPGDYSSTHQIVIPLEFSEKSHIEFSHQDDRISTTIEIPKDGDYHLVYYQKNRDSTSPRYIFDVKHLDHTKKEIILEKLDRIPEASRDANPYPNGKIHLRKGLYRITLTHSVNSNNVIINTSFESGVWPGKTYNCTSEDRHFLIKEETNRSHYLEISNREEGVCRTVIVGNLQPHQKYLFSYDVRHHDGKPPEVCLKTDESDYCRGERNIKTHAGWQHHEFIYEQGTSERAIVSFSVPGGKEWSRNDLKNFELRQVNLPETVAFVARSQPDTPYTVQSVEYRKIHPTKYRVILRKARGIVPIVLTENFHPAWRAYLKEMNNHVSGYSRIRYLSQQRYWTVKNKNLPEGTLRETTGLRSLTHHEHANGFSNLWYLNLMDEPKDAELVIEFSPQRSFVIGQRIAALTFVVMIIWVLVSVFRQHQRSNEENHRYVANRHD